MARVIYRGPFDIRTLRSDDLKKTQVEGFRMTSFPRGQEVQVEDDVAEALVENPKLYGKFELANGGQSELL